MACGQPTLEKMPKIGANFAPKKVSNIKHTALGRERQSYSWLSVKKASVFDELSSTFKGQLAKWSKATRSAKGLVRGECNNSKEKSQEQSKLRRPQSTRGIDCFGTWGHPHRVQNSSKAQICMLLTINGYLLEYFICGTRLW